MNEALKAWLEKKGARRIFAAVACDPLFSSYDGFWLLNSEGCPLVVVRTCGREWDIFVSSPHRVGAAHYFDLVEQAISKAGEDKIELGARLPALRGGSSMEADTVAQNRLDAWLERHCATDLGRHELEDGRLGVLTFYSVDGNVFIVHRYKHGWQAYLPAAPGALVTDALVALERYAGI